MKQLFTLLLLAFASGIFAQAPQSIPYQAVVRNTDGSVMADAAMTITFKIHDASATGNVVYEENHVATTNSQGLISLSVGNGSVVSGTFSGINWGNGNKFLQVLMNAGNGVVDLGTQQMMSVPYALYAEDVNVGVSATGDTLTLGSSSLIVPGLSNSNNSYSENSMSNLYSQGSGVYDIDGNFYPTIILYNGQEWMQKNLEVTKFRSGDPLLTGLDETAWYTSTFGAYVSSLNYGYGNYYNWYAVSDLQGICPSGWHVPSYQDLDTLITSLGGDLFAGRLLKSTNSWMSPSQLAFNLSGFSALAGSYVTMGIIAEGSTGSLGNWWSSSYNNNGKPVSYSLASNLNGIFFQGVQYPDAVGLNIRCIKD